MKIIISPAKKMKVDTDSFSWQELPVFLPRTVSLLGTLRGMSYSELKSLWKCSDAIASLNAKRLAEMDLYHHLTPAILAYEGIQYQYMAPGVFFGSGIGIHSAASSYSLWILRDASPF